jgi:16S rRNA (cytosine967-C5)-methyltransferase
LTPSAAPRPGPAAGTGLAARAAAVRLLSAVLDDGQPLDAALEADAGDGAQSRDRALTRAIVATALRRLGEIDAALDRLIARRPAKAGAFMRILQVAAAQVLFMAVADHAAVSIAVDQVAADRHARHFKGLANAALRRLVRERDTILAGADAARLNTPDWLWTRWTRAYGEATARAIATVHMVEPGLDVSVRADAAAWAERLGGVVLPTGSVRIEAPGPVEALAGYAEGAWWVQDAAAVLPVLAMGDVAGKRVADLCAAPGGKTAALCRAGARVTALDISADRLARLSVNLARLGYAAETVAADLLEWAPPGGRRFDAVLLDAPCTATGIIRRHPDVQRLKRPADVASLARLQARMIDRALALLAPGGILVYCACSLEPEEGEDHLDRIRHTAGAGVTVVPIAATEVAGMVETVVATGGVRTLPTHLRLATPGLSGLAGFFVMRLRNG